MGFSGEIMGKLRILCGILHILQKKTTRKPNPYQVALDQFLHQLEGQNVDFPLVFEGFWRNNKISVVPGRRREEG